jgi:hypothetical protein
MKEENILWKGKPLYFKTSGTTSGQNTSLTKESMPSY